MMTQASSDIPRSQSTQKLLFARLEVGISYQGVPSRTSGNKVMN